MELQGARDGIRLAAYRPNLPVAVGNGKATSGGFESNYYTCDGDGSSVTSRGSVALTGYETLDAPPHYDYYTNTEVWGRRKQFRPSLFQLHANPEVTARGCSHSSLLETVSNTCFSRLSSPV